MEYVYLLAGLPRLRLTDPPALTSAGLLAAMDGVARPDHREAVRAILEGRHDDVRHAEARRYLDADTQLRNALARLRARRAGSEYDAGAHAHEGYDLRCESTAAHAAGLPDPLARELALDRFRWGLLDEIATMPAFGVQALFAYAFKLRLSEKWAAMSDERGLELTDEIVERELAGKVP